VFIIDENSLLRNRILVATYCIGGPSERNLPSLDESDLSERPFFTKYPVLEPYLSTSKYEYLQADSVFKVETYSSDHEPSFELHEIQVKPVYSTFSLNEFEF
jgi:hypothetical protein